MPVRSNVESHDSGFLFNLMLQHELHQLHYHSPCDAQQDARDRMNCTTVTISCVLASDAGSSSRNQTAAETPKWQEPRVGMCTFRQRGPLLQIPGLVTSRMSGFKSASTMECGGLHSCSTALQAPAVLETIRVIKSLRVLSML